MYGDESPALAFAQDQWVYRFPNGYGASVIRGPFTYGGREGLFELGVIIFCEDDQWHLTYRTPITDDVIGHLPLEDVAALLVRIAALPAHDMSEREARAVCSKCGADFLIWQGIPEVAVLCLACAAKRLEPGKR
jgi:hypothetical protein